MNNSLITNKRYQNILKSNKAKQLWLKVGTMLYLAETAWCLAAVTRPLAAMVRWRTIAAGWRTTYAAQRTIVAGWLGVAA